MHRRSFLHFSVLSTAAAGLTLSAGMTATQDNAMVIVSQSPITQRYVANLRHGHRPVVLDDDRLANLQRCREALQTKGATFYGMVEEADFVLLSTLVAQHGLKIVQHAYHTAHAAGAVHSDTSRLHRSIAADSVILREDDSAVGRDVAAVHNRFSGLYGSSERRVQTLTGHAIDRPYVSFIITA